MEDECLWMIRMFERKEELVYAFPNDHLGVGDRYIYNRIIREVAKNFKDNDSEAKNKIIASSTLHYDIKEGMKKFGFKVRQMNTDC